jgi:predicted transcriptional regulator
MTETLSIRIDGETKRREEGPVGEIEAGLAELDDGQGVEHEKVTEWLAMWGTAGEKKAPQYPR